MPGANIELSTLDGKYTYKAKGPGILSFDKSGPVTLNGQPIAPANLKSSFGDVTATESQSGELAGLAMRSREGVQVEARTKEGGTKVLPLYSGYYALVVGCGAYHKGWPRLPNPIQDATEVAQMLEQMGWKVDLLLDPDWASLRKTLNSVITGPGKKKDKAILIWFSGHGHTLSEADGSNLGYIVPVDAPDPDRDETGFMGRAISMREIETVARRIQSKHVLMVFDSCFSGAIFQLSRAKPPPFIQEKVARPVRQFLTAGNEDEEVPDRSLFKTVFVQGVRNLDADLNKDGYVTGQELGAYLQQEVLNYSRKTQHPQFGKINNPKLDKGDFVFVVRPLPTKKTPISVVSDKPRVAKRRTEVAGPKIVADRPLVGKVNVKSNVDGAVFELSGHRFETKRNSVLIIGNVPVGEHEIIATKEDYPQWSGQVLIQPNQTASLSIILSSKAMTPDISDEGEINRTLTGWQDAWNRRDAEALLSLFADTANIMTMIKGKLKTVSKEGFSRIIWKKLQWLEKRGYKVEIDEMKSLTIQREKARAQVLYTAVMHRDGYVRPGDDPESKKQFTAFFSLIKRGSRWLIDNLEFKRM